MTALDSHAAELGVSGRSLRRAVERGTIRARRPSPRRTELSFAERHYVETHWELLASVVSWLRTQPNVRLAVVYGSVARGDDGPDSDIDLLVSLANEDAHTTARSPRRLVRSSVVACR
jgi:Polymerase beta, Nucleotidyltransferase